jgi:hypothetical protein
MAENVGFIIKCYTIMLGEELKKYGYNDPHNRIEENLPRRQ